jgi:hypothetical protein
MHATKPLRREGILSKELGDETVLYHQDGSAIHVLNRTALAIWELCDGAHTVQEMDQSIRSIFDLPNPQVDVAGDIERTLSLFRDKGLLV